MDGAGCFFSPLSSKDWTAIQKALKAQTTVLPSVTGVPTCYGSLKQFIYKQSIGMNANGIGAPAFIFVQQRDPITDPAVIQIPINP